MEFNISKMSLEEAVTISKWRYEGKYAIYSMDGSKETVDELLDGSYYSVLDDEDNLIGYYCLGASAQVPIGHQFGVYEDADFIDIGLGMRPDFCGKGMGYEFMLHGVDYAVKQFGGKSLRLTVADFNQRAIKVYERVGFRKVASFERVNQDVITVFNVMIKSLY